MPEPRVAGLSTNGGYCGAAVKPIALHMVAALARDDRFKLPISGIGGICNWRDAVEFLLLGSSSVQVCTEVMLRGYRIVEDMIDGLEEYMRSHQFKRMERRRYLHAYLARRKSSTLSLAPASISPTGSRNVAV